VWRLWFRRRTFAELKLISEGAFTVIAFADDGKILLLCSVADLPGAPTWFLDQ
jgi:hypothetical protein